MRFPPVMAGGFDFYGYLFIGGLLEDKVKRERKRHRVYV